MNHEATETFSRHLLGLMQRIKEEASQAEARYLRHSDRLQALLKAHILKEGER